MWIAVDSSLKAETPSPMNIYTFLGMCWMFLGLRIIFDDVLILKSVNYLEFRKFVWKCMV